jgi:MFS transporter, ACDE family, multidrug resistance protein
MLPTTFRWFLFVNALAGVGVGAGRVLTSLYAAQLQADKWLMGLIAGAQSLGLLLMALPAGALLERLGPRRLFVAGTIAAACAYARLS